jgi:mitotic spindle assembly checkpoint protein MAD1
MWVMCNVFFIAVTDPQLSTAKRKQRTQVFTSHMAHASLERQLLAIQTAKAELETKLRSRDTEIEELKRSMVTLVSSEETERVEREREQVERQHEKVCACYSYSCIRSTLESSNLARIRQNHSHSQSYSSGPRKPICRAARRVFLS